MIVHIAADGQVPAPESTAERRLEARALCPMQVACGARHSAAVTAGGQLLCWGWNLHSQCGGGACSAVAEPRQVALPPHLSCSHVHLHSTHA